MRIKSNSIGIISILLFLAYSDPSLFGAPSIFLFLFLGLIAPIRIKSLKKNEIILLISLIFIGAVSIIFSPGLTSSTFIEQLKGLIQLSLSLFASLLLFQMLMEQKKNELKVFARFIFLLLITGGLLEIIGLLKPISDLYRNLFLSSIYDGDYRDIVYTGHIRPKFFTSEPSHFAKGYFVISIFYLLLSKELRSFFLVLAGDLVMFWELASPIIILAAGLHFFIFFERYRIFLIALLGVIVLSFSLIINNLNTDIPQLIALTSRIESIQNGTEGSFNDRFIFPMISASDVFNNYPLFGLGITNKEKILSISSLSVFDVQKKGKEKKFKKSALLNRYIGNNGFFTFFIYFGVVGVILILFSLFKFLNSYNNRDTLLFTITFITLCLTMGGVVTPRFWVYLILLIVGIIFSRKNILQE